MQTEDYISEQGVVREIEAFVLQMLKRPIDKRSVIKLIKNHLAACRLHLHSNSAGLPMPTAKIGDKTNSGLNRSELNLLKSSILKAKSLLEDITP